MYLRMDHTFNTNRTEPVDLTHRDYMQKVLLTSLRQVSRKILKTNMVIGKLKSRLKFTNHNGNHTVTMFKIRFGNGPQVTLEIGFYRTHTLRPNSPPILTFFTGVSLLMLGAFNARPGM